MTYQASNPNSPGWRELYIAALFESDPERVPMRIAAAERAIASRTRELSFSRVDTIEEDLALDDALYALRALQNTVELRAAC